AGAGVLFDSLSAPERCRQLSDAYRDAGGTGACVLIRRAWVGPPPADLVARQVAVYRSYAPATAQARWDADQLVTGPDPDAVAALAARELHRDGRPFHIGVLLENVPEYLFWIGAAAFSGATVVGINPTRRGAELAADIRHSDCELIVTDRSQVALLEGLDVGVDDERLLVIDDERYAGLVATHAGASIPSKLPGPETMLLLLFTSGSTG